MRPKQHPSWKTGLKTVLVVALVAPLLPVAWQNRHALTGPIRDAWFTYVPEAARAYAAGIAPWFGVAVLGVLLLFLARVARVEAAAATREGADVAMVGGGDYARALWRFIKEMAGDVAFHVRFAQIDRGPIRTVRVKTPNWLARLTRRLLIQVPHGERDSSARTIHSQASKVYVPRVLDFIKPCAAVLQVVTIAGTSNRHVAKSFAGRFGSKKVNTWITGPAPKSLQAAMARKDIASEHFKWLREQGVDVPGAPYTAGQPQEVVA